MTFQPTGTSTPARGPHRHAAGDRRWRRPAGRWPRRRRSSQQASRRRSASSSASSPAPVSLNVVAQEGPRRRALEIRARARRPNSPRSPTRRSISCSQGGGGPGSGGRDITLYLGSDDPRAAGTQPPTRSRTRWRRFPNWSRRASRATMSGRKSLIKPRFDLAADLGVTTAALSQTIRIATLGDIDQNSAKFSLADRQVPIIVSLSEASRRDLGVLENLPVPTTSGGSVPLKSVAEIGFGSGPIDGPADQPGAPHRGRAPTLPPAWSRATRGRRSTQLPSVKNLPRRRRQARAWATRSGRPN